MSSKDTFFNGSSDRWIVFICKRRNNTGLFFLYKENYRIYLFIVFDFVLALNGGFVF